MPASELQTSSRRPDMDANVAGMTLVVDPFEQIVPVGVHLHDLAQLPIAVPGLHHLLASNGLVDPGMLLGIDQSLQSVALQNFEPVPSRCCQTRAARSLVTPM